LIERPEGKSTQRLKAHEELFGALSRANRFLRALRAFVLNFLGTTVGG